MIQRPQSLFLIAVVIVMAVALIMPIWIKIDPISSVQYVLYPCGFATLNGAQKAGLFCCCQQGEYTYFPYTIISLLGIAVIITAMCAVQQYKQRPRQLQLGFFNTLLLAAIVVCNCYFSMKLHKLCLPESMGGYKAGFILPAVAMICNMIANRLIRRDENLVRSAERLR